MTRFLSHLGLAFMVVWLPYGAWACDYSAPMRLISATLSSVQDNGGRVSPYHRSRLRQALQRMDVSAVEREMKGTLGRANQRAALAMLTLSSALVNDSGGILAGRDAEFASHLENAIRTSCLADTNAKAKGTATDATLEQGDPQVGNGGASGLTFRQGIARLSLIFTIYMTFLALVIGLRRGRNSSIFSVPTDDGPPPGGRAFSPRMTNELSEI